jgi:2TM domain-containing protein
MNEHERTLKAARQVEVMTGFYIHLVVFLLVCLGLLIVNWLATPEIWWAQWPFLGWGIGVVAHFLCAFGGPNPITNWRLQKIRELSDPARPPTAGRDGSPAMKTIGLVVLGLLIGSAAGGGYMYKQSQQVHEEARSAETSRLALDRIAKEQEAQLQQLSSEKSSLEGTIKEAKDQLGQLQAAKQATDQALKEARDQLTQAEAARDAAERALTEAKKERSQ